MTEFNKERGRLRAYCKSCHASASSQWAKDNADRRRAYQRGYMRKRRAGIQRKYGRCKSEEERLERRRAARRKWAAANPEKMEKARAAWEAANPSILLEKTRAYQTKKRGALPAWADRDAIKRVYLEARKRGMVVDHVVPLQHPLVCGLHVWENLQLLAPKENLSKGNRYWPDMP